MTIDKNTAKKGIYIHIPFCIKKCAYCSFNSYSDMFFIADDYVNSVLNEISLLENSEIDTIYIGGGTPSAIDEKYIVKILDTVYKKFDVDKNAEITIEVNPGTVTKQKFYAYTGAGINRLSIGAQDFFDENLKKLGRIHKTEDIIETVRLAKKAGFDNFSLDIMYGFDGQTLSSLSKSVKKAISLNPAHISAYALSIEEGTPLYNNKNFSCASDDLFAKMYETICNLLENSGYEQYELSNFAKNGMYSRHNTKYWLSGEYFGIGAGASGYINGKRYKNVSDIKKYIESPHAKEESDLLDINDKMSEFVILSLRLCGGISKRDFIEKFGTDIYDVFGKSLKKHTLSTKLLCDDGENIFLSKKAYFISNSVFVDFV